MRTGSIALLLALTSAVGCRATRDVAAGNAGTPEPTSRALTTGEHARGTPGVAIDALVVELPRTALRSMFTEAELAGTTRDALFVEEIRDLADADQGVEFLVHWELNVLDGGDAKISLVNRESYTKGYETDADGTRLTGKVDEGLWFAAKPSAVAGGAIRLEYRLTKRSIRRPIPGETVTVELPLVDTEEVEGKPVLQPGECWAVGLIALGPLGPVGSGDSERATLVLMTSRPTTLGLEPGVRAVPERVALEAAAER